ncbi:34a3d1d4-a424-4dc3-98f2-38355fdef018 [Sclerotinia trifoliorum]|uniref:34a3d1d4-a424-4dc3-98f2-38355fdef018 n=1 Tax=Sclerotinia trifoliorum TaxID=28548 RepID=A0A8H2VQA6_9HELO|nr:34a3d1d4-a424-4dc3-98f2-38355fdef018 [Sclerotinia trifoliorum]
MVQNFKLLLAGLASTIFVSPIYGAGPPAFLLAGDSTTAIQNAAKTGGGWGDGFISTLKNGAGGINYGHNGATTVSFVSGGDWAKVLASVATYKSAHTTFVTIQFGHNDQKAKANITVAEYKTNLQNMAQDVVAAGATPILVTPITRRKFSSSGGGVAQDLAVQANATIAVAKSIGAFYIDLNRASTDYVNAIGATNAETYNLIPTDFTHMNEAASVLFGNMVSGLIGKSVGSAPGFDIKTYTTPNATIAKDIASGTYIFPSGFGTLPSNTLSA